jgi:hypothetical protein
MNVEHAASVSLHERAGEYSHETGEHDYIRAVQINALTERNLERSAIGGGLPGDHVCWDAKILSSGDSGNARSVGNDNRNGRRDAVLQALAGDGGHIRATPGNENRES